MGAALELVENGQHFSSISIREVAKFAGVVPTSFYRHFTDLDDLGLSLVDELSLMLRQLMRKARQSVTDPQALITDSINLFSEYVISHRAFFVFLSQGLTGGSTAIRSAIRSELQFFANELSLDLRRMALMSHLDTRMLENLSQLTINTVAMSVLELVDIDKKDDEALAALKACTVNQLKLVYLGAAYWKSDVAQAEESVAD